jgi:hypothetical protein
MAQILTVVERILAILGNLVGLVNIINGNTAKAAQENVPFSIDTNTSITEAAVTDGTIGLAAIKTAIDTLTSNQATEFADIMAAIAATQQAGSPVTLPTTPPAGYGSVDAATIAATVWATPGPTSSHLAMSMLEDASFFPNQWASWAQQLPFNQYAGWQVIWFEQWSEPLSTGSVVPVLDWTTVIATDANAVDWLNRVAGFAIVSDFGGGCPGATDGFGNVVYAGWLNTPTFLALRDKQLGLGKTTVPPVWPGLAAVTLGTPVAISSSFTVTGPMHGVLIDITAILANKPFFDFDGSLSYRNIGALAFQEDNGDEEFPQNLGFTSAVYCPKSMEIAANCVVRADASITGTVTPWVVT